MSTVDDLHQRRTRQRQRGNPGGTATTVPQLEALLDALTSCPAPPRYTIERVRERLERARRAAAA